MEEILKKIEKIYDSGLRPVGVTMTQEFFDIVTNGNNFILENGLAVAFSNKPEIFGLPVSIKEPSHISYSIEVV